MHSRFRQTLAITVYCGAMAYVASMYLLIAKIVVLLKFNDFGKFYSSVQQFRQGGSLYAPNEATLMPFSRGVSREFLNLNPPHFHLLVLPFGLLPEGVAYLAWMTANAGLMLLTWRAIRRELDLTVTHRQTLVAVALFAAAAPTLAWIVTGQLTGILVALVTMIWMDLRNERWLRAGVGIGVACALKLFFAPLMVYLLLRRRWSALIAGACAAGVLVGLGLLVFGLPEYKAWISTLSAVNWRWPPMNASITAPFVRVIAGEPVPQKRPTAMIDLFLTFVSAAVVVAGLWAAIRARRVDDAMTVLLLTCVLASPLGWVYYHWIIAGPALAAFRRPGLIVKAAGAALLIPFVVLFPWSSTFFAFTLGSAYSWATAALWGSAVQRAIETGEPDATA